MRGGWCHDVHPRCLLYIRKGIKEKALENSPIAATLLQEITDWVDKQTSNNSNTKGEEHIKKIKLCADTISTYFVGCRWTKGMSPKSDSIENNRELPIYTNNVSIQGIFTYCMPLDNYN